MSYKNSFTVYIDGINRTANSVMPLKWGDFLDERLDEMHLSLRRIKKAHFEPLTSVEIVLSNKQFFCGNQKQIEKATEKKCKKYYLIANDYAEEIPFGSKLYDHDLYLIEVTKYAERLICDTQTITNDLGRYYDLTPTLVEPLTPGLPNFGKLLLKPYYSPILSNKRLVILPYSMVWESYYNFQTVRVFKDGELLLEFSDDVFHSIVVSYGYYEIQYGIFLDNHSFFEFAVFSFAVVENEFPLKKWTITDVINRLLDLAEPIRKGEKPRFRLNGMRADGKIITPDNKKEGEEIGQAYQFDKILCPQLSFTKEHLRECLQEVGKVIHGEPRLIPKKDADGWYFEVRYDMYGSGRMSTISRHKPYQIVTQHALESFCSALDSSAENLINTLDKYSGVISEPFQGGYKTVRTENSYVRLTDQNMIIATQYPIYTIDKVEFNNNGTSVDIKQYLFESSEYSRLSSYAGIYPISKLYALRFIQGERNIDRLNFKQEKIDEKGNMTPFGDYSIIAILKQELGKNFVEIDEKKYPEMQFRVTYTPIYNTRVSQTKSYYKDVHKAASLFYNQQSNLVETRSYGENMKGAVARLGNIEKTISYILYNLYSIPKAGEMYDEDYMISAVAVEFLPTYIKCTVALTKDFNRISQFIGVSSVKRYSEISETQALERNVLYREYIVIGDEETPDEDTRIGNALMQHVADTFAQENTYTPISCVVAWGSSYKGNDNPKVILPVISSAFGNSMSFSWKYEDNYSADDAVFYINPSNFVGGIKGYFQNTFNYTDVYGRIYYYNFFLAKSIAQSGEDAMHLPSYGGSIPTDREGQFFSTIGQQPYILRKDNREALQVNVQVDFVTNRKDMIIGSALASYCPAVRGSDKSLKAKLYVFPDRLDKFIDHVEGSANVVLSALPSVDIEIEVTGLQFKITAGSFPASGKAWAIVTNQYLGELKQVEDDKGNVTEQREVNGGDVLIAENIEFAAGQEFMPVYFTAKREVFDKTVWKDRR